MATPLRQKRVADRLQAILAGLIQLEMRDPRLARVTISRVSVDRELSVASIFVSSLDGEARREDVMRGMESAKGFLRREVGRRIDLRTTPRLVFHWDPGLEKVEEVGQLLDDLRQERAAQDEEPAKTDETDLPEEPNDDSTD
jgi:ribosome-binding factor A